ncbi:Asp-tRNA(Asn)/Glu-tRNA(Gln) amidotransferase subunit GatA [Candidatus Liberibacter americanus]|uniref:Glutamyl-tRNA(Gln) amidotransferase subunit A n=1 Tax=Candidatus Liberibacter americanus str. Sao Paulo TaxID=1261131 RepID=U6B4J3_9HYPH|nr:Asp-tRNA(Asn)/Glu-tRNA(Gln) amidotransferase subunit GatA [Candidatus Liberibacter americanus]AHA27989.1 Asp-tRNAAsn/Glu-tRNAGln amidotransferase A subunit [Candidatus Liberibacter americanus str. Sao Paulo]EMS35888.1 aspartyl/glutamyl-tRNA amidotransferase subunit A [Candidatus Liberibacter americanus PW_SP]
MSELNLMNISETRDLLRQKKISAVELIDAYIEAIDSSNPKINAYVEVLSDKAREAAKESDKRIMNGNARDLEGIAIGIKDCFATKGVHTQACSYILDGFRPDYESTVTQKLWDNGAIMLGKLNMDEFAMGSSNENSYYGDVINPWRAINSTDNFTAGGSSGGSSAAVASFLCAASLGTDTGGSVRQPAAFTGTVGIKPTYGRCSRLGIISFAPSLDQAGIISRTVRDSAILLKSIAGHDYRDSTCVTLPVPDYEAAIGKSIKDITVGIPIEYRIGDLSPEMEKAWDNGIDWLKDAGAKIVDISLPHTKYALPSYYIIAPAEASSNLARYDGVRYGLRIPAQDIEDMYEKTRSIGFGKEVKHRIMIGTYVLSADCHDSHYLKARKIRTLIKRDFDSVFKKSVDVILTPTTPTSAFPLGKKEHNSGSMENVYNDVFTVAVNMSGLPAISIPASLCDKKMPLGLQLIGQPFREDVIYSVGSVLEKEAGCFRPSKWW